MGLKRTSFLLAVILLLLFSFQPAIVPLGQCSAEIEVYFSPEGGIRDRIIRAINLSKSSIDIAIFDGKRVLTGSYKWTESAEKFNYENVVLIEDAQIVKKYQEE